MAASTARFGFHLTDFLVDRFAIAGTPADCVAQLSRAVAAGARQFIITGFVPDPLLRSCAAGRRRSRTASPCDRLPRVGDRVVHRVVSHGGTHDVAQTSTSVNHILNTPGFADAERAAMRGDNAAKLLRI
jgi:hypothetical protein